MARYVIVLFCYQFINLSQRDESQVKVNVYVKFSHILSITKSTADFQSKIYIYVNYNFYNIHQNHVIFCIFFNNELKR